MVTIWKYEFNIDDWIEIEMPVGAEVVLVEVQGAAKTPCMWCKVDPENPKKPRKFRITGTGHLIQPDWRHIASFQDRHFVWHIWE